MQNENDDIEGLFRRAAESYPLKTSEGDWDKVAQMLDRSYDKDKTAFFTWRKIARGLFILLLLVLMIGGAVLLYDSYSSSIIAASKTNQLSPANVTNQLPSRSTTVKSSLKDYSDKKILPGIISSSKNNSVNDNSIIDNQHLSTGILSLRNFGKVNKPTDNYSVDNFNDRFEQSNQRIFSKSSIPATISTDKVIFPLISSTSIENTLNVDMIKAESSQMPFIAKGIPEENATADIRISRRDLVAPLLQFAANNVKPFTPNNNKKNSRYWYGSLMAGPDLTNIKQQSYDKAGFSGGIIVGYSINKFIFESGLIWDSKYYSSDAKYFNPKVQQPIPYASPTTISGDCNMFEVPINVGYKLVNAKQNSIIIKTGISSYIMKNEYYDYNYLYYGQPYTKSATYKNSSKNIFSIFNVQLSLNHKISNSTSIGLEPYLKMPINGVGYGRLPLSSSGMYVIISRKL